MTDSWCQRPVLPPAGESPIDQPTIRGAQFIWPDTESFHYTRPKAFDEHVGLARQFVHEITAGRIFHVNLDAGLPPIERSGWRGRPGTADRIDPDHLRTEVCQHHTGERNGCQTRHFEDTNSK